VATSHPDHASGFGPEAARKAVGRLSVALAVVAGVLAVAHSGVTLPLISAIGPSSGAVVLPAAIAFGVGTACYVALAVGVARGQPWAWSLGLVVNGLALLAAAFPYRGWGSALGIVLTAGSLVALLSRSGRAALLPAD
jgi:hypothetical protein